MKLNPDIKIMPTGKPSWPWPLPAIMTYRVRFYECGSDGRCGRMSQASDLMLRGASVESVRGYVHCQLLKNKLNPDANVVFVIQAIP